MSRLDTHVAAVAGRGDRLGSPGMTRLIALAIGGRGAPSDRVWVSADLHLEKRLRQVQDDYGYGYGGYGFRQ